MMSEGINLNSIKKRLAIVISHPIQHFCPQYKSWSLISEIEIKVFFASTHGLDPYHDVNFGKIVQWKGIQLDFPHEFLPDAKNKSLGPNINSPFLDERLRDFSPDSVLVYGYSQALQRRAINWTIKNDKHLLMIGDSELRQKRNLAKMMLKKFVLPRILSKVDFFLTVGDANEAYYRSYGIPDTKLVRTFFPIDTESYDRALLNFEAERKRIRNNLQIPEDHIMVLMTGKLVSWKRQIDLIGASNLLQRSGINVTVVLAGTGECDARLKSASLKIGPGGVIFAGFVVPEQLVSFYLAADIYAHCSEVEPHSLAISEAIYVGLPIVISDKCGSYGPSDDVRHGLNGFVYQCGSVDALTERIIRLASDSGLRARMRSESLAIGKANQKLAHGRSLIQVLDAIG